jgi:acetoin:2,6-dichlorophenolindophenol oxidoreductase subunit alpha
MALDLWALYERMLESRLFEEAVAALWHQGLISGEMHLGTGEEAIIAGVVSQLVEGDAMALDHRGTAALLMRGVDPALLLRELLGQPEGLCGGMGGHMHLFSPEHLAASTGIVGAGGPVGAGFGLAAQLLRPGTISVVFFGEGAMNQGMLMESLNLAAVWRLPVLFVCKDDGWSIGESSQRVTGGSLANRARGLGVPAVEADGRDVADVWHAVERALKRMRDGRGPTFLRARCVHLEGHFLGFQMLRTLRRPLKEGAAVSVPLTRSLLRRGGGKLGERVAGLQEVSGALLAALRDPRRDQVNDPVRRTRRMLCSDTARLEALEGGVEHWMHEVLVTAMPAGTVPAGVAEVSR